MIIIKQLVHYKNKTYVLIAISCVIFFACESSKTGDRRFDEQIQVVQEVVTTKQDEVQKIDSEEFWPESFGYGRRATVSEIALWDIDIMPDGRGLPKGRGTADGGRAIYLVKCASCHGQHGEGEPYDVLISSEKKSIGTYWPYATTLFDYIRRAMPFNMPGSLTDEEVYALTAYLLSANGVIDSTTVIDQKNLPLVEMPAKGQFVWDDRRGGPEIR